MTTCDKCKYQREDGRCKTPKRAWDIGIKGKNCYKKSKLFKQ